MSFGKAPMDPAFGKPKDATVYDAIVVGAGGMGSAALYHLSKRGLNVLGLEQHALGHALGSSHGETRAMRCAYFEHPDYVPLVRESCSLWRALESETGQALFTECGMILAGHEDSELIAGSLLSAKTHGIPLESIGSQPAHVKFPGFAFEAGMTVLFEPGGGFLKVEDCVSAHCDAAKRQGARIVDHCRVQSWTSDQHTVTVKSNSQEFRAASLVICAGPWSSWLLHGMQIPLRVDRIVSGWFEIKEASCYACTGGCPVFGFDLGDLGFFYGFPSLDGKSVKVARHGATHKDIEPDALDRELRPKDFEDAVGFISRHLPGVTPTLQRHSVCMYTMTDSGNFVIDTHPEFGNVHIACGFSGHGFKFSPVVGAILADLVEQGKTARPAGFLKLRSP